VTNCKKKDIPKILELFGFNDVGEGKEVECYVIIDSFIAWLDSSDQNATFGKLLHDFKELLQQCNYDFGVIFKKNITHVFTSVTKKHKSLQHKTTANVPKSKTKIPEKNRRSCFKIVFKKSVEGLCPVCKSVTIGLDKGRFHAAHIKAEAKGGKVDAENLVPTCGCNLLMETTNLFDYMGSRIELRPNLWQLACSYWIACTPPAQIEKELQRFGKKFVLVEFLKVKYQPVDIEKYKDWLEIPESWSVDKIL